MPLPRLSLRWFHTLCAIVLPLAAFPARAQSEGMTAVLPAATATDETALRVTLLRSQFLLRVADAGFTCNLAAPVLAVDDVPSFGQYNPDANTLRTSDWSLLSPQEHAFFTRLAGPGADEAQTRALFEVAAHRWIFVHELGHWWQACNGHNAHSMPYQTEYDANRVALSYWREVDPSVVSIMMPIFQSVVDHMPSPMPPGQDMKTYFNANYQTLGPSPAYPWFMSKMILDASAEQPAPGFATVLRSMQR